MRALEPRKAGTAVNASDGVSIYYEEFGPEDAEHTVLLLPTWSLVHSRVWKMQVPYLVQRGFRVVAFDGRGNGRSGRPATGYTADDFTRDTEAVLDELEIAEASLFGFSAGGRWGIQVAAQRHERVDRLVLIAPATFFDGSPRRPLGGFTQEPPDREGWNKYNAVHWREDYRDFVAWFASQIFTEPHSTKGIDDILEWSADTTPEMLIQTTLESRTPGLGEHWSAIRCPVLLLHGSHDAVIPVDNSVTMHAMRPDCHLVVLDGCGHAPHIRDAVKVNLLLGEFLPAARPSAGALGTGHARA